MTSVRNVLAIAGKELRSYFASPMAYVIIGLFALLFGQFFYAYLDLFVRRSSGMGQMPMRNVRSFISASGIGNGKARFMFTPITDTVPATRAIL